MCATHESPQGESVRKFASLSPFELSIASPLSRLAGFSGHLQNKYKPILTLTPHRPWRHHCVWNNLQYHKNDLPPHVFDVATGGSPPKIYTTETITTTSTTATATNNYFHHHSFIINLLICQSLCNVWKLSNISVTVSQHLTTNVLFCLSKKVVKLTLAYEKKTSNPDICWQFFCRLTNLTNCFHFTQHPDRSARWCCSCTIHCASNFLNRHRLFKPPWSVATQNSFTRAVKREETNS